eukprot:5545040-Pleurochrysis_carterae.AAC.2
MNVSLEGYAARRRGQDSERPRLHFFLQPVHAHHFKALARFRRSAVQVLKDLPPAPVAPRRAVDVAAARSCAVGVWGLAAAAWRAHTVSERGAHTVGDRGAHTVGANVGRGDASIQLCRFCRFGKHASRRDAKLVGVSREQEAREGLKVEHLLTAIRQR